MWWEETEFKNLVFPYFSTQESANPIIVTKAKGSKISVKNHLGHKKTLIDGLSSWWSVLHGYQHPEIIKAINKQTKNLTHIMFGGICHDKAIRFSNELETFLDHDFSRFFFCDSGSVAVEIAIQMAFSFFNFKKNKIIYFENSYHGDTIATKQLSGSSFSENFTSEHIKSSLDLTEFEQIININKEKVCAIIIEPLCQSAGGMKFHSPEVLNQITSLAKQNQILTIFDECATGFYRTGSKFAYKTIAKNTKPDILILGKALSAGMVPGGATCITEEVFNTVFKKTFSYGPTFMANPLFCTAGLASIEILKKHNYEHKVQNLQNTFDLKGFRKLGAIFATEIPETAVLQIRKEVAALKYNSFLRPFGTTLYAMPPLNISQTDFKILKNDLEEIYAKYANNPDRSN